MRFPRRVARDVIDWRPYAQHLRALGYDEASVHRILSQNEWDFSDDSALKNLTRWSLRRDVDIGEAVAQRLLKNHDFYSTSGRDELKVLLQRVPFWLDPEDARGLAEWLVRVVCPRDLTRVFLGVAPKLNAAAYERLFHALVARFDSTIERDGWRIESLLVHLLALKPWSEIPSAHRRLAERYWVNLHAYPAWTTERVTTGAFGLRPTGWCPVMTEGHLRALGLTHNRSREGSHRKVRVDGRLIGAIKNRDWGDPSMVALRNVTDRKGRLILALGGVYQLPYKLLNLPETESIEVDTLVAGPLDFLMNAESWDGDNPEAILELFMSDAEVHECMEKEFERSEAEGRHSANPIRLRDTYHEVAHVALLRRLDLWRKTEERHK